MKNFIALSLDNNNTAYVIADDIVRVVEIGTEQNGINRKRTLVTFADNSTLTSVESAKDILFKMSGKAEPPKPTSNKPQGSK
jgi:hypothetical protein